MKLDEVIQQPGQMERIQQEAVLNRIRVSIPGFVIRYDKENQCVDVQPAIRDSDSSEKPQILLNVPVWFPGAYSYNVNVGDECLVIFADSCIDAWWQNGGVSSPFTARKHDFSDGIAFVGIRSLPNSGNGKTLEEAFAEVKNVDTEVYYIDKTLFKNPTTTSSNASSVINNAITAARDAGKSYCMIPDGTYWLTETVYLADSVILCGSGMDSTTLKIADGCDIDAIRVSGPINNSGIMDLSIDGNRITNYSVYSNGHHGNAINVWLHYGRIERVRTNWVYKHSLLLNYDTGTGDDGLNFPEEHRNDMGNLNKVLWCDFKDSLLQGIMWGWRTMDSWMCFTNIGSHAANLYLEGGTSRFIGNHFDGDGDSGHGPEYNVYCGDGCTAMLFAENIFENTQKENIFFRKPSYANETKTISICNNIIRTCSKTSNETYANIRISGYDSSTKANQIIISGNQILNPDTNANHGYAGIHLSYCGDVKIVGNSYFNVGLTNVVVDINCTNVLNDDALINAINSLTNTVSGKSDKVSGATAGNFAGLDANGNLTDSGKKASDFLTQHQDISGKADKVESATNGHLAGLNSSGNLTDSGLNASSVENMVLIPSSAISIPSVDSSPLTVYMTGMTANHRLVQWNFSASAENKPPVKLKWETFSGYFQITNYGGSTTTQTIRPMFVNPKAVTTT